MIESNDENEVRALLADRLREAGVPEDQAQIISGSVVEAWAEEVPAPAPAPGKLRAAIRSRRWVIRNDDLGLLEIVGGVAVAALTAATGGLAAGLAAVVVQILVLERRLRKKGIFLDRDSFAVLSVLKAAKSPMSAAEVAKKLGHEGMRGAIQDVSPQRMEKLLDGLTRVVQEGGTSVALVARQADLWRVTDV